MLDIGMFELLLILILALLVLGPERLPEVARLMGALSAKIRRTMIDLRSHVEQEINAHELQQRLKEQANIQLDLNNKRPKDNENSASKAGDQSSICETTACDTSSSDSAQNTDVCDFSGSDEPFACHQDSAHQASMNQTPKGDKSDEPR